MTIAVDILREADRHGVRLVADGGEIRLAADAAPPPVFLNRLKNNKSAVLSFLNDVESYEAEFWSWLTTDSSNESDNARRWRRRYLEAIRYWNNGRTLVEARRLAWGAMQRDWLRQYGAKSDPNICAACGEPIVGRDHVIINYGTRVHADGEDDDALVCLVDYSFKWRAAANEALLEMGLMSPKAANTMSSINLQPRTIAP